MTTDVKFRHGLTLDLALEAGDWPDKNVLETWFDRALGAASQMVTFDLRHGEISIVLTDDAHMQTINAQHRGQDKPTNVLSFPALEPQALGKLSGTRPFLLGDLVFAKQTIEREAAACDLRLDDHMCHLIVHGFLHLLGYDHDQDDEAEAMEALETAILAMLDIANPYAQAKQARA